MTRPSRASPQTIPAAVRTTASTCPRSRTAVPRVTDTPPTASGRDVDAGFPPLLGGDRRRRARQRIAAGGGFGKGHALPNGIDAGEHRRHPVQTEGDAAVRRRAVPKSLEEEAELRLGLLTGQPDHVEDLLLHAGTMDTDRPTTELDSVDDDVVGAGQPRSGLLSEAVRPFRRRRGEGMVHRGPAAAIGRLEHREVGHAQEAPRRLLDEATIAADG